jgi:peptidoglycan hydrolase-like protein with peptidoglycan-binding domain
VAMHAVAATLQTRPLHLLGVMNSESGMRASAHNPNGHASGLIQFMPVTLVNVGWPHGHAAFRRLTAEEQMPFVERYYRPYVRQGLNSTARLYQATLLPATLHRGSEPDTVIVDANRHDNAFAYAPNRGLDRRGDGRILVGDLSAFVEHAKRSTRWHEAAERLAATPAVPSFGVPVVPLNLEALPAAETVAPPAIIHPLLRRGARGDAVREAQTKLNTVHASELAASRAGLADAPLVEDGVFGVRTYNATVAFQQLAFPADPREWDGVIGPKTWAALDAATLGSPPKRPPAPVPASAIVTSSDIEEYVSLDYVLEDLTGPPIVFTPRPPFRDLASLVPLLGPAAPAIVSGGPVRADPGDPSRFQTRIRARIAFPATTAAPSVPAGTQPLPLAVLVHGNHTAYFTTAGRLGERPSYRGYGYLQDELARQGIASISVDTNMANQVDSLIELRADIALEALRLLKRRASTPGNPLRNRIDFNRIALMGHSRGGDAVVRMVKKNQLAPSPQRFGIRTACSLAPTDFTGGQAPVSRMFLDVNDLAFYSVLYGTLDGDVHGQGGSSAATGTGFRHYDRARCPKGLVFAERCCHNSFNSVWQADGLDGNLDPSDVASGRLTDERTHQALVREYIAGQFAWQLKGLSVSSKLFNGTTASTTGLKTVLLWSFGDRFQHVDDFENPAANLAGGARRLVGGALVEDFGSIRIGGTSINDHVLEQSHVVHTDSTPGPAGPLGVETTFASGRRDLSSFAALALDVGAFFDTTSPNTIASGSLPTFTVELHDAAGAVARVDAARFTPAMSRPFFHRLRNGRNVTALRLETLHVSLAQFRGVDRRNIVAVHVLAAPPNGHLFIDDIKLATL